MNILASSSKCQHTIEEVRRRTANYHPTIWGDFFLAYSSDRKEIDSQIDEAEHERLKEEVRNILITTSENNCSKLDLIDAIQRLGLAYNFEKEIEELLKEIYNDVVDEEDGKNCDNDLHVVALRFRLLRQHGFPVSQGIFRKFKDHEGKFMKSLGSNLRGLLSLYEAAHFRVHGENILEEALTFTTSHLKSFLPTINDAKETESLLQSLKLPIRKMVPWVAARRYIPTYGKDELHSELLLRFAKLNFNILQKMHQKELCELTKWWKNMEAETRFPYARDRLVETYFWAVGVYSEPKYRLARKFLFKVGIIITILDDTYDAYGTIDELTLFTDAIVRTNSKALDGLPSSMKHWYEALLDIYSEMEVELGNEGKEYLVTYIKEDFKKLSRHYYEEAKWFSKGYVPQFGEYMKTAVVSIAHMLVSTTAIIGMGELATKETLDWVTNEPLIVRRTSLIARLMDDMGGREFEQQRGHIASAVECYMNQYGVSEEEAVIEITIQVQNAWKDISSECLHPTAVPMTILEKIVNLARMMHLLYQDKDLYSHSTEEMKEMVTLILVDPIPI